MRRIRTTRTGRALGLALGLAAVLGLTGLSAVSSGVDDPGITPVASAKDAKARKSAEKVRTSYRYDQTHWEAVPDLGGATCVKTRIQGTFQYEYEWIKTSNHKQIPVLRHAKIESPQVTVSAWNKCSGAGRKAVKLSRAQFDQRWLNSNECSANGLSVSVGGPPLAFFVGTTINCGETRFLGNQIDFARVDNDFHEGNSGLSFTIKDSALKTSGTTSTGQWKCARVDVGGRVYKSNRADNFIHRFHPCIQLPKFRYYG